MNISTKGFKILSIFIACWGIIFLSTGVYMEKNIKPKVKVNYTLSVEKRKIPQAQAKSNEIKLKDIEIEINNPISVNIKDYLENYNNIDVEVMKSLKLDTSLVNINQPGVYQYTITYKKKKYLGNVKVNEKKLPIINFTLKNITLTTGEAISTNPRTYIKEEITDEVYNNITLDISRVNNQVQDDYEYYILYNGTIYKGEISIRNPGPTIITSNENKNQMPGAETTPTQTE